ncbi:MAG: 5,10-methylenetetrahydrofolate reductase [Geminicoccaceae bacterium]|nr:MAG: 5,10-methylenetetrahydrofolate reductase [Geminicoccaceae bacterium]
MTASSVHLSFEIFPPKTAAAADVLHAALADLAALQGRFLSITSGAGGGTPGASAEHAISLGALARMPARPHLTCVQGSRGEIEATVTAYLDHGITQFVALRGDSPAPDGRYHPRADGFTFPDALVAALKGWGAADVAVGAYPEVHPEAPDEAACLAYLQAKVDAGADRILTQYCFETDTILRWRDRVVAAGIDVPIGVGIMPIGHFPQIKRFSERCGAGVPDWLARRFAGLEPGSPEAHAVAVEIAAEQCARLVAGGMTHLHVYTLNKSALTLALVRALEAEPLAFRWAA